MTDPAAALREVREALESCIHAHGVCVDVTRRMARGELVEHGELKEHDAAQAGLLHACRHVVKTFELAHQDDTIGPGRLAAIDALEDALRRMAAEARRG